MTNLIYILPYFLSIGIGYVLIHLFRNNNPLPFFLHLSFSILLGLALSGHVVFYNLTFLNELSPNFIVSAHIILFVSLLALSLKNKQAPLFDFKNISPTDWLYFILLAIFLSPTVIHAISYPLGGWDAWSNWNLKSKFIFLADNDWQLIFHPVLKESNIQYPYLLPLINVWTWCFGKDPVSFTPMINAILFTFVQASLLAYGLKHLTKNSLSILPSLVMLSLYFFAQNASSQYSDILVSTYALATMIALLLSIKNEQHHWLMLFALMAGILTFTKTEGLVLGLVMLIVGSIYILFKGMYKDHRFTLFGLFAIAFLPFLIFKLLYCPTESGTFINGLTSADKPAHINRLGFIVMYWAKELLSLKWMGVWIGIVIASAIQFKRFLQIPMGFIPIVLIAFLGVMNAYYFINTHFDLPWWLSVTASRELLMILPLCLLWVSLLWWDEETNV